MGGPQFTSVFLSRTATTPHPWQETFRCIMIAHRPPTPPPRWLQCVGRLSQASHRPETVTLGQVSAACVGPCALHLASLPPRKEAQGPPMVSRGDAMIIKSRHPGEVDIRDQTDGCIRACGARTTRGGGRGERAAVIEFEDMEGPLVNQPPARPLWSDPTAAPLLTPHPLPPQLHRIAHLVANTSKGAAGAIRNQLTASKRALRQWSRGRAVHERGSIPWRAPGHTTLEERRHRRRQT